MIVGVILSIVIIAGWALLLTWLTPKELRKPRR